MELSGVAFSTTQYSREFQNCVNVKSNKNLSTKLYVHPSITWISSSFFSKYSMSNLFQNVKIISIYVIRTFGLNGTILRA
jgi:hypothetical protein